MAGLIALYLRLSQDDVDLKSSETKTESDSIHSQRSLIKRYLEEHSEFAGLPTEEFVDDGFTGTNFSRPQFQKMLEKIRSGEIRCVIVKDLSRFGRNYIEVGDYLEHIFPFLGIRFIAINDHYDSDRYIGTTGGIDIAFRNLIYQKYSQDLSEKVKSAMHMKMSKGKYVTHCPYGYTKPEGVKHQMIKDPVTAPIVREIFLSVIAGMKTTQVAAMLNERGIPTPMVYKNLSRSNYHNEAMWSHQAILRIIKDYKYTGAMVNFKCENETIRASAQRRRKPDEWVVVENSHEPIVSHEEYEAAGAALRKVNRKGQEKHGRRDLVYYCGYCGRRLRRTHGNDEYYSCATSLYRKSSPCAKIWWPKTAIEEIVLASYKAQLILMDEELKKRTEPQPVIKPAVTSPTALKQAMNEYNNCDSQNLRLYEQYRGGVFDQDTFLKKKAELLQKKADLQIRIDKLQKEVEAELQQEKAKKTLTRALKDSAEKLDCSDEELREKMYDDIEKITVYENKEIDIQWKFPVPFRTLIPAGTVKENG